MTGLAQHHIALGATLAPDRIPLHYGDLGAELEAASKGTILLDRSHEGRILLKGPDCLNLVNRMSTNDIDSLRQHAGCATIFTNANARILFRALCLYRPGGLLLVSEAGQGSALAAFLQRNIFYGDRVTVENLSAATAQFALHGAKAGEVMAALFERSFELPLFGSVETKLASIPATVARRVSISGDHWLIICASESAAATHRYLLQVGAESGLKPAGSLTYNAIRIRSGRPAGLELSTDYIPLEVGLWDEVSVSKGCYTGQEIIARMESRGRLAKALVNLKLSAMVAAPAQVYVQGRAIGKLTSSVLAADGEIHALAVLRLEHCRAGSAAQVGPDGAAAQAQSLAAVPPPYVARLLEAT